MVDELGQEVVREQPQSIVMECLVYPAHDTAILDFRRCSAATTRLGVLWLSGHFRTQEAIDKATSVADETEVAREVRNHIKIEKDDCSPEMSRRHGSPRTTRGAVRGHPINFLACRHRHSAASSAARNFGFPTRAPECPPM